MTGRMGINGKEEADTAARDATLQGIFYPVIQTRILGPLRQSVLVELHTGWDHTPGKKLRKVKPVVQWRDYGNLIANLQHSSHTRRLSGNPRVLTVMCRQSYMQYTVTDLTCHV